MNLEKKLAELQDDFAMVDLVSPPFRQSPDYTTQELRLKTLQSIRNQNGRQ